MSNFIAKLAGNSINVILVSASRLLVLALLARSLTKEDYGLYSLLLWGGEIFVLFVTLGYAGEFARYIPLSKNKPWYMSYIKDRFIKINIFILLGLVVTILLYISGLRGSLLQSNTLPVFLMFSVSLVYVTILKSIVRAEEKYKKLNVIDLCSALLVVLTVLYLGESVTINYVLIAFSLVNIFMSAYIISQFLELKDDQKINSIELKKRTNYSLMVWFNSILAFILWSRAELFFVEFHGLNQVALYSVAITIAGLLFQFSSMMQGMLLPHFSGNESASGGQYLLFLKLFSLVLFLITIIITPLIGEIIRMIFGEKYLDSVGYSTILVLGALSMISGSSNSYLLSKDLSKFILIINALGGFALLIVGLLSVWQGDPIIIAVGKGLIQWFIAFLLIRKSLTFLLKSDAVRVYFFLLVLLLSVGIVSIITHFYEIRITLLISLVLSIGLCFMFFYTNIVLTSHEKTTVNASVKNYFKG